MDEGKIMVDLLKVIEEILTNKPEGWAEDVYRLTLAYATLQNSYTK